MPDVSLVACVLAACGAVILAVLHRRHVAAVREDRGRLFDGCMEVLGDARVVRRGLDFPVLEGRRHGSPVRVEPVVDTLSMRTVPVLWLVASLRLPRPAAVRLSVLARTCGTEFYSRHGEVGVPVDPGPGWPGSLSVRCDRPERLSAYAGLLDGIAALMADGRVKQVVLAGATARVVWRGGSAVASTYRVTRRVDLSGARADARELGAVLDTVLRLAAGTGRGALTGEVAG